MKPTFANRPNTCLTTTDGNEIWHSRSCAVVAEVALFHQPSQQWYLLIGQRGSGTPDFQGYWCLPCGYLDWDESLHQALYREVWEECGFDLQHIHQHPDFAAHHDAAERLHEVCEPSPWMINDKPNTEKQNISLHYANIFAWQGNTLPPLSNANCEPNEVDALVWCPLNEVDNYEFAFNHRQVIHAFSQRLLTLNR